MQNVLFLCTANSARSIIAEALLNSLGGGRFRAFSAGSEPAGKVHPLAIEVLEASGYSTAGLRSKSWNELTGPRAPRMDMVITVCDSAAGQACPFFPGQPLTAHWSVPDPAAVEGDDEARRRAFRSALAVLRRRIQHLTSLPIEMLGPPELTAHLRDIARY
jgi:arsenate reductase